MANSAGMDVEFTRPPTLRVALSAPETVEGLELMGLESRSSTPAELSALLRADHERWGPLVKAIGFSADS